MLNQDIPLHVYASINRLLYQLVESLNGTFGILTR
jgi:hypothetical protein